MLSIRLVTSLIVSNSSLLTAIFLLCILNISNTLAEVNVKLHKEPILPIPQNIDVDIEKVSIGEDLFFDVRLSRNNQLSCASCHQLAAGGDDNVTTSISMSTGQQAINTPSIFNARYNFRQNWDGSIETLQDQIDSVIHNQHKFDTSWDAIVAKLTSDVPFKKAFQKVYVDGITRDNLIDALVEFEKTLITPDSPFDKYLRGNKNSLSDIELKGYLLFKELGCISCHQGINIGGNLYQKFGVFYNYIAERGDIKMSDYGRMNVTQRPSDAFVFKVPSLRNIAITAPYLHDGSAITLEEAISIMGKTQLGRTLTIAEIEPIISFLKTLTGEYKKQPLDSNP